MLPFDNPILLTCTNDTPMGTDMNQYHRYHRCKGHSTNDCKIIKRDIKNLIQKGLLKSFVARRELSKSP